MAEETKGEEIMLVENHDEKKKLRKEKNGKHRRDSKRDDTPIEELFDLSKPIPRVERPNKAEHERELDDLSNQIKVVQDQRQKVQEIIDKKLNSGKGSEIAIQREALSKLRSQKGALIDEKKQFFAKLDAIKFQRDKLEKDRKDTRASVKFHNVIDIDREIAKLKKIQETTSMSLSDEKKLIKDMEALQSSKKLVADLKTTQTDVEDNKLQRKSLGSQIAAKDKEIDAVQILIAEKLDKINAINVKENRNRNDIKELFAKRDNLRKQIGELFSRKDTARASYREKNNSWYNQKRALEAQRKMLYEAEKRQHEDELEAWRQAKKEEESKKVPYEEEQALCDFLSDYLTRTYLVDKDAERRRAAEEADAKRMASITPVVDDPFAGFKPMRKKEGDDKYFGKGKGRKKRDRLKKREEKASTGPFTLNVDTFEQFALIGLNPPSNVEQVEKVIEDLNARKLWFSKQPRGSVPTATEVRRANEKAAAKLKSSKKENGAANTARGKMKENKFFLSEADFAPLGSSTGTISVNNSWGQKMSELSSSRVEEELDSQNKAES